MLHDIRHMILYVFAGLIALVRFPRRDDAREVARLRTERIIATVRGQQRSPRVVERNLAWKTNREIERSRWPLMERITRELETSE